MHSVHSQNTPHRQLQTAVKATTRAIPRNVLRCTTHAAACMGTVCLMSHRLLRYYAAKVLTAASCVSHAPILRLHHGGDALQISLGHLKITCRLLATDLHVLHRCTCDTDNWMSVDVASMCFPVLPVAVLSAATCYNYPLRMASKSLHTASQANLYARLCTVLSLLSHIQLRPQLQHSAA